MGTERDRLVAQIKSIAFAIWSLNFYADDVTSRDLICSCERKFRRLTKKYQRLYGTIEDIFDETERGNPWNRSC